jgi:hypothetical protein
MFAFWQSGGGGRGDGRQWRTGARARGTLALGVDCELKPPGNNQPPQVAWTEVGRGQAPSDPPRRKGAQQERAHALHIHDDTLCKQRGVPTAGRRGARLRGSGGRRGAALEKVAKAAQRRTHTPQPEALPTQAPQQPPCTAAACCAAVHAAPLHLLDPTCSTAMSAPPPRVNTESALASMSPPTRG